MRRPYVREEIGQSTASTPIAELIRSSKQHPQRASAEFQRAILNPLSRGIGVQKGRCVDRSDFGCNRTSAN
jgi:hypothetical protein